MPRLHANGSRRHLVFLVIVGVASLKVGRGAFFWLQSWSPSADGRHVVAAGQPKVRGLNPRTPQRREVHLRRAAGEQPAGAGEVAERSTFDESPGWVKSVVGGLTWAVNSLTNEDSKDAPPPIQRKLERVSPEELLEGVRSDFEDRQYLWSGDIDAELYAEDCTFTDPTLSFKGLDTFQRNIRNLRPVLDAVIPEENRRCILRKLQTEADGKVSAEWTMIGHLSESSLLVWCTPLAQCWFVFEGFIRYSSLVCER
eukprot:TRINITY_DN5669_c0_g1_i1.p1 TRINITY_DN5669_c0_g1~~TRINITY_DN5669_c0_g1_i1.p1  ORF type:complete len:255 (-),score=46.10 TRINITY_DN5669_c0_g1_i1:23-787(-)